MSPLVRRSCCPVASSKLIVQEFRPLRGLHPRALPSVPPAGGCGLPGGPTQPLSLGTSPRPLITVASALAAEKSSRGPLLSWPS